MKLFLSVVISVLASSSQAAIVKQDDAATMSSAQNSYQLQDQAAPTITPSGSPSVTTSSTSTTTDNSPKRAPLTGKSAEIANARVRDESTEVLKQANYKPIAEALSIVEDTRRAQASLENRDTANARATLERAITKADTLSGGREANALVPFSVELKVIDTQPDEATLRRVSADVNRLVSQGRHQAARLALKDVASEINIVTGNLSLATFPAALRRATAFIDQGKNNEALTELSNALYTIPYIESLIPIPVIRAEALIDEANRQMLALNNPSGVSGAASPSPTASPTASPGEVTAQATPVETPNRTQIDALLRDADQQLRLAEEIGYGDQKDAYSSLRKTISNIQTSIAKNSDTKGLFTKAKTSFADMKIHKRRR